MFESGAVILCLTYKHAFSYPRLSDYRERSMFRSRLFMLANSVDADFVMVFYPAGLVNDESELLDLYRATTRRVREHFKLIRQIASQQHLSWLLP